MINYVNGDVTEPVGTGVKVIVHCCNDIFVMGGGVALTLRNKWPDVYEKYKELEGKLHLGDIQLVKVTPKTYVCNLIGQHGVGIDKTGRAPIRYDAINEGLHRLYETINSATVNVSVHMPRMGAGLAGGRWEVIEQLININLIEKGIPVTVYDFVP